MSSATVRKPDTLPFGLDPRPLFGRGLAAVRGYARNLWTDHNVHDPGITALELLCYALTDVCYRADYPVEDLLATAGDDERSMAAHFFGARRVLPNAPLTELDYRRLLLDVPGVRNAWLHAVTEPPYHADPALPELRHDAGGLADAREVRLRGLHGVRIEYAQDADPAAVEREVRAVLHANRNLCEDFAEVSAVQTQLFLLCAEVELEPGADTVETHAALLLAVENYLAPDVPRYTREEMLRRPKADGSRRSDPEILEGPAPRNGFVDEDELAAAELRSTLRLSDVISEVMDVPGVRAVREIVIRPADMPEDTAEPKWEVRVEPGRRAHLDPAHSRLVLYKGGMPLPVSPAALPRFEQLKAEHARRSAPQRSGERPIPLGRFRGAAAYESVQNHFPALYGVGEAALPWGAGVERQAQARQLQAWLLFFDQWLANDCAQLANLRRLFSLDPDLEHSYFSQPVEALRPLYAPPPGEETPEGLRNMLDGLAEERPAMLARRNRFLDHLMARFAERLQDYVAIQQALFGATASAAVHAKCAYLAGLPELGAGRGLGFDYTRATEGNASGLEKRLAHLLGLGTLVHDIYQERDADGIDEFRFRVRRRFSAGVLLSSTRSWPTAEEALQKMTEALAAAQRPGGYQRRQTTEGEYYFNLLDAEGHTVARRIQYFPTAAARDAAIDELIALTSEHRSERLCVVENILLRPRPDTAADAFLPICADSDDPYSYRLHIVLPAEAGRFRNMDFRRFAEGVIREETPAHLLPKICWVSNDAMARIEKAWAAWRDLLAGRDATGRAQKFAELRDALYESKNVYPPATLADCAAPAKFILGRSALGSMKGTPE
jgi:hypothetical protein